MLHSSLNDVQVLRVIKVQRYWDSDLILPEERVERLGELFQAYLVAAKFSLRDLDNRR